MNNPPYDYAIIGGDKRQVYLAKELSASAAVTCYALSEVPPHCNVSSSLEDAIAKAHCIIAPIPLCQKENLLNQNAIPEAILTDDIVTHLKKEQIFFAGCIPENFLQAAKKKNLVIHDLMNNASLAIYNSLATAEGAICEAIQKSPLNLHHSNCAVLGYGRCGRTITAYLKGMFCNVSVFSKDPQELHWATIFADCACESDSLITYVDRFDFIFNTIPTKIITANMMQNMRKDVTIIDIASAPGGVDYENAYKMHINASLCPGLPGRYSPYSSAKAIKKIIQSKIKE